MSKFSQGRIMEAISMGQGNTDEFIAKEFEMLDLKDKRLVNRAKKIFTALQTSLTSCIRRLFLNERDAHQAYHFF
jgi:Transposase DNA-binding